MANVKNNNEDGEGGMPTTIRPRFFVLEPATRTVLMELRNNTQFKLRSMAGLAEATGLTPEIVTLAISEAGQLGLLGSSSTTSGKTLFGLTKKGFTAII